MKRIGQKQLSLLLCLVLLFTMAIPAGARASDYFNNTYVSATAVGGGTLRIKVDVAASGIMQELGATEIIVHERQANGTYKPVRTFTRNQNANLIRKNCASRVEGQGANARKEVLIPTQIRSQNIKNKVLYEKEGQHL